MTFRRAFGLLKVLFAITWAVLYWPRNVLADQITLPPARQAQALDNAGGSARALAMGSAFVAVPGDDTVMLWNPAGLAYVKEASLGLHHNAWLMDTFQDTASAVVPLGPVTGAGLLLNYVNFGAFEGRDELGNPTAGFSAYRMGGALGWGGPLPRIKRLYGGLALRGSVENLADASYSSMAADVGMLWQPLNRMIFGAAYHDLGSPLASFMPAHGLQVGAAWWATGYLLLAASTQLEPQGVNRIQSGLETSWKGVYGRAGYLWSLQDNRLGGINSLTLGGGVKFSVLRVDYAWLPFGTLGDTHRFSVQYRFAKTATQTASLATPAASPAAATTLTYTSKATFAPNSEGKSLDLDFDFSNKH